MADAVAGHLIRWAPWMWAWKNESEVEIPFMGLDQVPTMKRYADGTVTVVMPPAPPKLTNCSCPPGDYIVASPCGPIAVSGGLVETAGSLTPLGDGIEVGRIPEPQYADPPIFTVGHTSRRSER